MRKIVTICDGKCVIAIYQFILLGDAKSHIIATLYHTVPPYTTPYRLLPHRSTVGEFAWASPFERIISNWRFGAFSPATRKKWRYGDWVEIPFWEIWFSAEFRGPIDRIYGRMCLPLGKVDVGDRRMDFSALKHFATQADLVLNRAWYRSKTFRRACVFGAKQWISSH